MSHMRTSASLLVSAVLPDNQHGVLFEEDDGNGRLRQQPQQRNERKLTIFSLVKFALSRLFQSCCVLIGKGPINPSMLMMLQQFVMALAEAQIV